MIRKAADHRVMEMETVRDIMQVFLAGNKTHKGREALHNRRKVSHALPLAMAHVIEWLLLLPCHYTSMYMLLMLLADSFWWVGMTICSLG